MSQIFALLVWPTAIVVSIWLVLHYRSKGKVMSGLTQEEQQQLSGLMQRADRMTERVETLEKLLDVESPQWRQKHEQ